MKLKISRETGGKPNFFLPEFPYMGVEYRISRTLTGTTNELDRGIFTPDDREIFVKDRFKKEFIFKKIDFVKDPLIEIGKEIKNRITTVSAWVKSIPAEEFIEIEIEV